ncbi:uncharacterized protein LOC111330724 isoform X1 [Stylophora pistillata]|uniref:uncharacterized protein LOC111330724 isoform X1 n=1 Tax=Stylophora pistillata TaxID=50429 RepID=UPI000C049BEF|nr:uncharacterized protein LOC111330724 isoform X1 [Stylophora pistillata]
MATAKTSFEIVGDESPKEVAEVDHATGQVCDFEGNLGQGEQPANVEEYDPSSEQSTETEEAGKPGLSFGSFRQAHHDQMEKRPDTCEKENSELVQSGRDEFHTRNRERRHRVQQLFSEGFTRVSQKPGKWDHTGARPKVSQEIDSYSELMLRAIESSRAKPFSVESQIGQRSDHGSLSFSLPLRDQQSKIDGRDGSGNRVSPSSAGLVTEPLPNSAEGSEVDTPFIGTIQMPGNLEQTCARRKEKIEGRDGSRNQVSASSTGLVSEPLLNSAEGGEIDCVVPSTIQMPALGESQPPMTGLPLATPGIYPSFMARHPTDQSLCGGPAVSNTAAPGNEPEVRSAVLPPINNTSPALGRSQPPTAGLRLATPGIYP